MEISPFSERYLSSLRSLLLANVLRVEAERMPREDQSMRGRGAMQLTVLPVFDWMDNRRGALSFSWCLREESKTPSGIKAHLKLQKMQTGWHSRVFWSWLFTEPPGTTLNHNLWQQWQQCGSCDSGNHKKNVPCEHGNDSIHPSFTAYLMLGPEGSWILSQHHQVKSPLHRSIDIQWQTIIYTHICTCGRFRET